MKTITKIIIALITAAIVSAFLPGILFIGITRNLLAFMIPLAVSTLHIFFLGIPALLLGLYLKKIRWWSTIIASFVVGAIPIAILTWPLRHPQLRTTSSRWEDGGMVYTMIDGVPTATGWSDYIMIFSFMGLFGIIGGLAFWFVYWVWIKEDLLKKYDNPTI